mmetsp:Transcript_38056/g.79114  ORF Transcript_38056/g.79114 Transcript_38056/m.79114 type:complete len:551 (+) Transcript_38056:18-1670(+)
MMYEEIPRTEGSAITSATTNVVGSSLPAFHQRRVPIFFCFTKYKKNESSQGFCLSQNGRSDSLGFVIGRNTATIRGGSVIQQGFFHLGVFGRFNGTTRCHTAVETNEIRQNGDQDGDDGGQGVRKTLGFGQLVADTGHGLRPRITAIHLGHVIFNVGTSVAVVLITHNGLVFIDTGDHHTQVGGIGLGVFFLFLFGIFRLLVVAIGVLVNVNGLFHFVFGGHASDAGSSGQDGGSINVGHFVVGLFHGGGHGTHVGTGGTVGALLIVKGGQFDISIVFASQSQVVQLAGTGVAAAVVLVLGVVERNTRAFQVLLDFKDIVFPIILHGAQAMIVVLSIVFKARFVARVPVAAVLALALFTSLFTVVGIVVHLPFRVGFQKVFHINDVFATAGSTRVVGTQGESHHVGGLHTVVARQTLVLPPVVGRTLLHVLFFAFHVLSIFSFFRLLLFFFLLLVLSFPIIVVSFGKGRATHVLDGHGSQIGQVIFIVFRPLLLFLIVIVVVLQGTRRVAHAQGLLQDTTTGGRVGGKRSGLGHGGGHGNNGSETNQHDG